MVIVWNLKSYNLFKDLKNIIFSQFLTHPRYPRVSFTLSTHEHFTIFLKNFHHLETYLSWPAVSQIWSLIFLPLSSIVLILKSIPIVEIKVVLKASSENLQTKLLTPSFFLTIKWRIWIWVSMLLFCWSRIDKIFFHYCMIWSIKIWMSFY